MTYSKFKIILSPLSTFKTFEGAKMGGFIIGVGPQINWGVNSVKVVIFIPEIIPFSVMGILIFFLIFSVICCLKSILEAIAYPFAGVDPSGVTGTGTGAGVGVSAGTGAGVDAGDSADGAAGIAGLPGCSACICIWGEAT